jgi:hypothetical protein
VGAPTESKKPSEPKSGRRTSTSELQHPVRGSQRLPSKRLGSWPHDGQTAGLPVDQRRGLPNPAAPQGQAALRQCSSRWWGLLGKTHANRLRLADACQLLPKSNDCFAIGAHPTVTPMRETRIPAHFFSITSAAPSTREAGHRANKRHVGCAPARAAAATACASMPCTCAGGTRSRARRRRRSDLQRPPASAPKRRARPSRAVLPPRRGGTTPGAPRGILRPRTAARARLPHPCREPPRRAAQRRVSRILSRS